jgi:hypothetical protein
LSNLVFTKTKLTNAIFLAVVLVAGTFVIMSPSFLIGGSAQTEPYYDGMNQEKKYGYDKPYNNKPQYPSFKQDNNYYKSKDNSISIKKVNCNNVNLNINDASVNNVGRPPIGDTTSLDASGTEDQEITTENNFANGERNGNNGFKKDKDGFVYVCINNNNNEGQGEETPSGPGPGPIDPCVLCFLNADIVDEIELTLQLPGFLILELPGVDLFIGADILTIEQLCRVLQDHTPQLTVDQLPLLLDVLDIDIGVDLSQTDLEILEKCLIDTRIITEEDNLV